MRCGMRSAVYGALCVVCLALGGCGTSYSWRPTVPEGMRTVSVPTLRNESNVNELGAIAARQILREFQREGTFGIRANGDAALEVQGVVKSASTGLAAYNRRTASRVVAYDFTAEVEISVIDKRCGKVLIDNRVYRAQTSLTAGQDATTARRDASGRLADDLARQVVDDVLGLKW